MSDSKIIQKCVECVECSKTLMHSTKSLNAALTCLDCFSASVDEKNIFLISNQDIDLILKVQSAYLNTLKAQGLKTELVQSYEERIKNIEMDLKMEEQQLQTVFGKDHAVISMDNTCNTLESRAQGTKLTCPPCFGPIRRWLNKFDTAELFMWLAVYIFVFFLAVFVGKCQQVKVDNDQQRQINCLKRMLMQMGGKVDSLNQQIAEQTANALNGTLVD